MDERLEPCRTCGEVPHIWKTGKFLQDLAYDERQLAYDNDPQCRPLLITEVVIVRCEKCGHQVFRPISEPGATASAVYRWNRTYGRHKKETNRRIKISDQNERPAPSRDPRISDMVKSILDEPMHQPRYSIKHYIGDALSSDAFRDAAQHTVNTAWTKINPLVEAPVLHDPLTLEDEWNIRRSTAFLVLGRDIGEYPGDEFFKNGAPIYQHFRYKFMGQMFDTDIDRKPTIAAMERVPIRPFVNITPPETPIDLHKENI